MQTERIAFIGGGNMASAIIGGLIRQGLPAGQIEVVEPSAGARERLRALGVGVHEGASDALNGVDLVVWAVKPQSFAEAAEQSRFHAKGALHLSVAAGIRSESVARWLGTERIVRSMPNTPALIGKGITALYARVGVTDDDQRLVERVIGTTGEWLWVHDESHLDAVTALSGSGPAYVFYFIEAMTEAGAAMGLPRDQAQQLAIATFVGAAELAHRSDEPPETLRQRVTSKGGTTYAALTSLERDEVKARFGKAMEAARARAKELGDEFGG